MADSRRRMVVEEVTSDNNTESPLSEVKERVEELKEVTQDLNEDVEKAEDVQEEIIEAVEEADKPIDHEKLHEHIHQEAGLSEDHTHEHEKEAEEVLESVPEETQEVGAENHDDTPDQFPPLEKPKGTNPLIVIVPGIFLLGALLGGIYFYQKGINLPPAANTQPTPAEAANPSATPTTGPSVSVDLTKYPVNIMNGSGIAGEAGKVKTILEGGGFKVSATGNASSYNFTKTVVKVKSDVPASFVSQLTTLLGKTYELDTNQTLPASSSDLVQVIVGSTKAK